MHIPDPMLQGSVCPATAVVSAIGIATAAHYATKGEKPSATRFAAITALIFAAQMLNFPIMDGTSGHLLGGVLAASLLGIPFGVLSIALVVVVQSLFFSDGGVTVLGANLLNMAIIGAGLGGMLRSKLAAKWQGPKGEVLATALAAWASVVLASFAVGVQLALDGQIVFAHVITAMLSTHLLIGFGEAVITVGACLLIPTPAASKKMAGNIAIPTTAAMAIALLLSPFASRYPDGLEWVAAKYQFLHESAPVFVGPLADYSVPFISNEMLSTGLSGLIGVIISFTAAWALHQSMSLLVARNQIH
ncbi:MAG: energy-coupling factor ABC transporter permease [Desulfuromonadaceae bacterium]|nr:energy-coupling factor ABC transporter permease [Desulfuromonadaceae bacterium]